MHEMTLVSSILDIINSYETKYHFNKVNSLTLSYGEYSCINENSLKFAFEILSQKTKAENAKLIFQKIPAKLYCNHCKKENIVKNDFSKCVNCGSDNVILSSGMEELTLLELDLEVKN